MLSDAEIRNVLQAERPEFLPLAAYITQAANIYLTHTPGVPNDEFLRYVQAALW